MYRCRHGMLVLLLGCGGGREDTASAARSVAETAEAAAAAACVDEHPPAEPFDVGSSFAHPTLQPSGTSMTAGDIAQLCRAGDGSDCDQSLFISLDAATCVARARGLAAGIRPWDLSLGYYDNHQRVIWLIMTVTEEAGYDGYWGESMLLDAITGSVLERGGYTATP